MRNLAVLAIAVLVIAGCGASQVWVKPRATTDEFSQDKYDCMKEAQKRVPSAYANRYGGVATDDVITNDQLFNACMNARGWYLQPQDR